MKRVWINFAVAAMVGWSVPALADDATKVTVVIKDHRFTPAEIHVPAGKRITITVDNQDATPEEFESHELKFEKVIAGSSKGIVRFGPVEAGTYGFFGEFNEATAQGKVIVE